MESVSYEKLRNQNFNLGKTNEIIVSNRVVIENWGKIKNGMSQEVDEILRQGYPE